LVELTRSTPLCGNLWRLAIGFLQSTPCRKKAIFSFAHF
jgi:hypothetical protein